MLPPFTAPLATPTDPDAWRGGKTRRPNWRQAADGPLDTAAVHALVRAANLPRPELLHMGWTEDELSASAPEWLSPHRAALMLGRIVADAAADRGEHADWADNWLNWSLARANGRRVIEAWFHA